MDVHAILVESGLRGVKTDSNGWRACSPFRSDKEDSVSDPSLSISATGAFNCHATGRTGHVVQLYAHCRHNDSTDLARTELMRLGYLDRSFTNGHHNPTKSVSNASSEDGAEKAKALFDSCIPVSTSDWSKLVEWRKIGLETVKEAAMWGSLRQTQNTYCFFSTQPPSVVPQKMVAAMSRYKPPEKKWMSYGAYPIWVPWWKVEANTVLIVEGQWDALCIAEWIQHLENAELVQPMALCGPKNIERYPEILAYFRGKRVVIVPDFDKPDKGGKRKGEEILIRTHDSMEGVDCEKFLLRIPPCVEAKDFNEWVQKDGLTADGFRDWYGRSESFFVRGSGSVRIVVDDEYCRLNGVKKDEFFIVGDNGKPVDVYTQKQGEYEIWDPDQILEWIKDYPMLSEYVNECVQCMESPVLWHVMCYLTYLSAAFGRRIKMSTGANNALYPMLATIIVGPSGLGKSQSICVLRHAMAEAAPKGFFGPDNFSAEALFEDLSKQGQRMFVFQEFSEFFPKSESSYKHQSMKGVLRVLDSDQYSSTNPLRGNFRSKDPYEIADPAVTILAAAIDSQMEQLDQDTQKGGLIGRCFFAVGRYKHCPKSVMTKISPDLNFRIRDMYRGIFSTPIRTMESCRFTQRASIVYDMQYHEQENKNRRIDFGEDAQTYLSRWRVQVMRLAMLFEISSGRYQFPLPTSQIDIRESSLVTAMRFEQILRGCFMTIFKDSLSGKENSKASRMQVRIIRFMQRRSNPKGVSRTEISKFIQDSKRELSDAIDALVESGILFPQEIPGAGRPKTVYFLKKENIVVNPDAYETSKLLEKTTSKL